MDFPSKLLNITQNCMLGVGRMEQKFVWEPILNLKLKGQAIWIKHTLLMGKVVLFVSAAELFTIKRITLIHRLSLIWIYR